MQAKTEVYTAEEECPFKKLLSDDIDGCKIAYQNWKSIDAGFFEHRKDVVLEMPFNSFELNKLCVESLEQVRGGRIQSIKGVEEFYHTRGAKFTVYLKPFKGSQRELFDLFIRDVMEMINLLVASRFTHNVEKYNHFFHHEEKFNVDFEQCISTGLDYFTAAKDLGEYPLEENPFYRLVQILNAPTLTDNPVFREVAQQLRTRVKKISIKSEIGFAVTLRDRANVLEKMIENGSSPVSVSEGINGTFCLKSDKDYLQFIYKPLRLEVGCQDHPKRLIDISTGDPNRPVSEAISRVLNRSCDGLYPGEACSRELIAGTVDRAFQGYFGVPDIRVASIKSDHFGKHHDIGSLQVFIPNCTHIYEKLPITELDTQTEREVLSLTALDIAISNMDRHAGNALVSEEGYWYPIDHGRCLPRIEGLKEVRLNVEKYPLFGDVCFSRDDDLAKVVATVDENKVCDSVRKNLKHVRDVYDDYARFFILKAESEWLLRANIRALQQVIQAEAPVRKVVKMFEGTDHGGSGIYQSIFINALMRPTKFNEIIDSGVFGFLGL